MAISRSISRVSPASTSGRRPFRRITVPSPVRSSPSVRNSPDRSGSRCRVWTSPIDRIDDIAGPQARLRSGRSRGGGDHDDRMGPQIDVEMQDLGQAERVDTLVLEIPEQRVRLGGREEAGARVIQEADHPTDRVVGDRAVGIGLPFGLAAQSRPGRVIPVSRLDGPLGFPDDGSRPRVLVPSRGPYC